MVDLTVLHGRDRKGRARSVALVYLRRRPEGGGRYPVHSYYVSRICFGPPCLGQSMSREYRNERSHSNAAWRGVHGARCAGKHRPAASPHGLARADPGGGGLHDPVPGSADGYRLAGAAIEGTGVGRGRSARRHRRRARGDHSATGTGNSACLPLRANRIAGFRQQHLRERDPGDDPVCSELLYPRRMFL
jgi:hypothetical protein